MRAKRDREEKNIERQYTENSERKFKKRTERKNGERYRDTEKEHREIWIDREQ